jgi:hypothetical protein
MKKRRLILLGVAAVTLLLLVAAVILLVLEIRSLQKVKNELEDAQISLDRHYSSDPFPAQTNVAAVLRNCEEILQWRRDLVAGLSEGQVLPDKNKTPAAFINELSDARIRLVNSGGAGVVDGAFAFGFGRYFEATAVPPDRKDVPRLVQQLRMIETVTGILFEEKISRLSAVERETFEVVGRGGGSVSAGLLAEGANYARFHYQFSFEAGERALNAVLNRLASLKPLAVVTEVRITKVAPDVVLPSFEEDEERGLGSVQISTNALPRDARIVSGLELAQPVSVELELDIYWFREGEE